ncbi:ADP-ribosylglycohydrolase family protein, partial [bacterium]|nr:ADP-ribosylglycohydrolase family protein [bacterium]
GLYCALCASDFEAGVVMAVNHDGDSDSTGLIAGHLLGAIHGVSAIPARWLEPLELRTVLEEVADDLATCGQWVLDDKDSGDEQNYYCKR